MIKCIIVDDEQHAIDLIELYVKEISELQLVGTSTDPLQALQMMNTFKVDLIFLDIQMPALSGIDFIKAIRGKSRVILITAYSEFALESYELDVVDYLLKPIRFPRFVQAVHKAIMEIGEAIKNEEVKEMGGGDYIFVKTDTKRNLLKIELHEITYIEGMKNYVAIHRGAQKTLVYTTMKDLEQRLPKNQFIRVHKSYIIPLAAIKSIEGNLLYLKGVIAEIPIGESYRTELMELVKNKLIQ